MRRQQYMREFDVNPGTRLPDRPLHEVDIQLVIVRPFEGIAFSNHLSPYCRHLDVLARYFREHRTHGHLVYLGGCGGQKLQRAAIGISQYGKNFRSSVPNFSPLSFVISHCSWLGLRLLSVKPFNKWFGFAVSLTDRRLKSCLLSEAY